MLAGMEAEMEEGTLRRKIDSTPSQDWPGLEVGYQPDQNQNRKAMERDRAQKHGLSILIQPFHMMLCPYCIFKRLEHRRVFSLIIIGD